MTSSSTTMPALIPLGAHTGKPPIPLRRPVLLIGSRNIAHLHLLSSKVSKAHALIINSDGKIYIRDLASRTRVYVNGEQIRQANLSNGDLIKIGSFTFRLTIPPAWRTRPRDTKANPAQLNVDGAEMPVRLDERVTLIGRRPTCDISLLEESASTAHAVIFEMGGRRFIRDLGSRTGTFVNGRKAHQEEINFGDVIRIGETDFNLAPASEIPTGPIPADELDADFDELEDLVGTAPLMEEPPEVIAKRLEQEQRQAEHPDAPASPQASDPIPFDLDEDAVTPEHDIIQPRPEAPTIPADHHDAELDPEDVEPLAIPVDIALDQLAGAVDTEDQPELAGTSEPVAEEDRAAEITDPAESSDDDFDLAPFDDAAVAPVTEDVLEEDVVNEQPATGDAATESADPAPAGIEDLDLLDLEAPATEAELDLADDLDLETEPAANDPEATHALPPALKPKPKAPPGISDEIVDEPIAPAPEAIADEEPAPLDLDAEPAAETPSEDPAGDTVALAAQASLESADEEDAVEDATIEPQAESDAEIAAEDEPIDEETFAATTPTPESAQSLEPDLQIAADQPLDPDALTDTGFDREIHAFASDSAEPVEEQVDDALPLAHAQPQDSETETDTEDAVAEAEEDASTDSSRPAVATDVEDVEEPQDAEQALDLDLAPSESEDSPLPIADLETEDAVEPEPIAEVTDEAAADETPAEDQAPENPAFAALDLSLDDAPVADASADEDLISADDEDEALPVSTEAAADDSALDLEAIDDVLPIVHEAPAPVAEIEVQPVDEPEPETPAPAAEAPTPKPSEPGKGDFTPGVNQWGFLGGTPLVLGDLPPPPPPARGGRAAPRPPRGMPFGKKPLPVDDIPVSDTDADDYADPFTSASGPLPNIDEIDVFSQLGAPPEDDPFFGAAALGQAKVSPTPEPHIPPSEQGAADAEVSAGLTHDPSDDDVDPQWAEQQAESESADDDPFDDLEIEDAAPAEADELPEVAPSSQQTDTGRNGAKRPAVLFEEQDHPRRKRRWFFSVPLLFVLMLVTASAAAAAIWYTVPVAAVVTGNLPFENLKDQPAAQRNIFFDQQAALLADQADDALISTRERAKAKLRERYGNVSAGFLEDPQTYALLVDRSRQAWLNASSGSIQLRIESPNPDADSQRLHALLLALFEGNRRLIDQHNNARHNADEVAANLRVVHEEITRLQVRLEELKREGERPASATELAALKREIITLEAEWRAADDAARETQAQIERMREAAARAVAAKPGDDSAVAVEDAELRQMQEQFERLNQRLEVTAVADNLEIDRTRRNMDAAITQLEAQIEQVKNQMADVPEMKGYVTVAKIIQDTTHQLTEELIHSQKQQLETINAHKRKLDEQLVARQNEVWENDPDLKNLTALLDIQRRHYNAAIGADHPPAKEGMDELAGSIARLEQQIEDRRRVLGNDLIYADAIRGMEELIRTSEKRLAEDQKRTEQRVAMLQQQLAEAAPDLQKLPEEQKKLAAELEKRLVEMNDARKAYSEAMARATDDGGDARRDTEAKALALQRQIESRRQALLSERLQALSEQQQKEIRVQIQAKTDELNTLQAAARDAHTAYLNRSMHLAALENGVAAAVSSASKRDEIARELAGAQLRRDQLAEKKKEMDAALAGAIVPVEPTPAGDYVQMSRIRDDRPLYALISVGGIALVFGILMLTAHHAHTRSAVTQRVTEVEPPLFPSRETIDEAVHASTPERLQEPTTA